MSRVSPVWAAYRGRVLIRGLRTVLVTAAGAGLGLGVYALTRIGPQGLYVAVGAAVGAAVALTVQFYSRNAHLSEVKISVPHFSQLTFIVNDDARHVAWKLYVEIVTRVSVQPLPDDAGIIREAMNSLYGLFGITRETLKASRPTVNEEGPTVEHLAVGMLNRELRPFLATWHPRLRRFEDENPGTPESDWADSGECRRHLRELQGRLHDYALALASLAGVQNAAGMIGGED